MCEENTGNECDSYMKDSFASQKCPPYHSKIFKVLCIADCQPGMLDNGAYCIKRSHTHMANTYVFNYYDLYE